MILITGATGLVGGALARRLHGEGQRVRATGRDLEKGAALQRDGIEFFPADLTKKPSELCRDCTQIVHCAALATPWAAPEEFERANVEPTRWLLGQPFSRFVYVSSAGVYFSQNSRSNVREVDPLPTGPQHPYLASKRRAEDLVQASSIPSIILRPRAIYGPGDAILLPRLRKLCERGLPTLGSGRNLASMTHVDNLVEALRLALREDAPVNRIFNITDGAPVPLWDVVAKVAQHLGLARPGWHIPYPLAYLAALLLEKLATNEPPLTRYTLSLLVQEQTLDISAAQRDLAYRPLFDTWSGVGSTLR